MDGLGATLGHVDQQGLQPQRRRLAHTVVAIELRGLDLGAVHQAVGDRTQQAKHRLRIQPAGL